MIIALMCIEEHQHSLVSKISFAETAFVETMDLRVSKDIAYSLQIDYHYVTLSQLP